MSYTHCHHCNGTAAQSIIGTEQYGEATCVECYADEQEILDDEWTWYGECFHCGYDEKVIHRALSTDMGCDVCMDCAHEILTENGCDNFSSPYREVGAPRTICCDAHASAIGSGFVQILTILGVGCSTR